MHTSKTPPVTKEWAAGYDAGYSAALRKYRELLLAEIQVLEVDVTLSLLALDELFQAMSRIINKTAEEAAA